VYCFIFLREAAVQLDHLSVVLRPRRPWQALDLGFRMTVRWWRELMTLWFCVSLPWFLLCAVLLVNHEAMYFAPLLLWWAKPTFERPLLYFASRAVFGEQPSLRNVLRNLGNIVRPQALSWLSWRRFSPTRSFDMPVTLLEGLNGRDRSVRIGILHMNQATPASWLTLLGAHVEIFLAMAFMVLMETMLPAQMQWHWFVGNDDTGSDYAFWYLLSYLSMSFVAPFYVVCGFALYLNRRAQLEAWDIEIAFRRMRQKHGNVAGLASLACIGVLLGSQLLPAKAVAAEPPKKAETPSATATAPPANTTPATNTIRATYKVPTAIDSRQAIVDVMQDKVFNEHITYKIPKWFDKKDKASETPAWMRWLEKWLKQLSNKDSDISKVSLWLARVVEFLLWTMLIAGIALIAWRYRAFLRQWLPNRTQRRPLVWRMRRLASREGIDLDELPTLDDIGENARTLWQQREQRAAMALLYVASLYEIAASDIALDDSHTELECLELAQQHLNAAATQYFVDITMAWLRLAYAHQAPADSEFIARCDQWREFIREIHASAITRAERATIQPATATTVNTQLSGAAHG